jgi:zinc transport system permease protein
MVSCALIVLEKSSNITSDTALGILAHSSLAIGIVVFSLLPTLRMDLASYLFGDILAISWKDIYWIYLGGSAIMLVLARIWRPLLSLVIQRDLALVDGISETRTRFIFLILLSFVVAISMQIVGILLIVSLLIIPAATVRRISSSPEQMAVLSSIAGVISVIGGISISLLWDTPAGPSIVVASSLLYLLSLLTGRQR